MAIVERLLRQRRLVLTVAVLLSLLGLAAWLTMIRQEDPRLPDFWGQVVAELPGADAEMVERLVVEPIEEALAEVREVKVVESTSYADVAVLLVELRDDVDGIPEAWDEVREALAEARRELPEGAGEPVLNSDLQDQESVVLAITGSADRLRLAQAAEQLEDALVALSVVAEVLTVADPGEQVVIEVDDAVARRLGLSAAQIADQLRERTRILGGGSLHVGGATVRLRPVSELQSVAEIAASPIALPGGATVPLEEVATVHRGPEEPAQAHMRFGGELAVGLGVVPREQINVVEFGNQVRAAVAKLAPTLAPLVVHEVTFQPDRVEGRLAGLSESLLLGVLIVAGILILAMGLRLGLLVASIIPLVAASALAVYFLGGGVLHQMSIAALVIALGMLVDNAIVVAENVQWRLDSGDAPQAAAAHSVRELAVPLGGATATTLAAFVPMLIARGPTAEFTRAIPVLIMLTLSVSYLFALLVTPTLAEMVLVPGASRGRDAVRAWGRRLGQLAVRRPVTVVVAALAAVGGSLAASVLVPQEFFPASDRNQVVVDLKLPEGSHLSATDAAARVLERQLMDHPDVRTVATFVGRSAPHFYYNLMRVPWSPHFAQLVVFTNSKQTVAPVVAAARRAVADQLPGAEVVARHLAQGPPVNAPVELRVFGDELHHLDAAASRLVEELRSIDGTEDVRHDLGPGAPTLRFIIDDAAAARYGLSRADVAMTLYGRTRGLPVGELRAADDPVPIVVRSSAGEEMPAEAVGAIDLATPSGELVPLAQVARVQAVWRPAAISHRDGRRLVTVSSQLAEGVAYTDVLRTFEGRLVGLELGPVEIGYGGDAEGAGEANSALMRTLPIGGLLLLGVLLAEFNSFRRLAIVLVTVPLAAAGVVPGLLLAGEAFGFMSFLGVIALVGVVVNNAIVLLEVIDQQRRAEADVPTALAEAVARRIRPILLTTATTVAGLLPLALGPSSLWPPLAWAMISGLLGSTVLTLVVVPALYRLLLAPSWRMRRSTVATATAIGVVLAASAAPAADVPTIDLIGAMARSANRPAVAGADAEAQAADAAAVAEARAAVLPTLGVGIARDERDRNLALDTPFGAFPFGASGSTSASIELRQPILDPVRLWHTAPAARADARAARATGAAHSARAGWRGCGGVSRCGRDRRSPGCGHAAGGSPRCSLERGAGNGGGGPRARCGEPQGGAGSRYCRAGSSSPRSGPGGGAARAGAHRRRERFRAGGAGTQVDRSPGASRCCAGRGGPGSERGSASSRLVDRGRLPSSSGRARPASSAAGGGRPLELVGWQRVHRGSVDSGPAGPVLDTIRGRDPGAAECRSARRGDCVAASARGGPARDSSGGHGCGGRSEAGADGGEGG